jgi:hypothetical protein
MGIRMSYPDLDSVRFLIVPSAWVERSIDECSARAQSKPQPYLPQAPTAISSYPPTPDWVGPDAGVHESMRRQFPALQESATGPGAHHCRQIFSMAIGVFNLHLVYPTGLWSEHDITTMV